MPTVQFTALSRRNLRFQSKSCCWVLLHFTKTNSLYKTLRIVTKYYFVDKQRKWLPMAGNNLLISRSVPFGRNCSLRCLLMPLNVSSIHATYLSDGFEVWHFRVLSRGKNLLFFVKTICFFFSYAPCSTGPVSTFTVNHRCTFKYRTRKPEIEQVPIYTSRREKLKRKNWESY